MNMPQKLVVGDVVSWFENSTTDNLGNSIAPETHSLYIAIRGPTMVDLTGSSDVGRWMFTLTKQKAENLVPGTYYWQAYAVNQTNDKFTIGTGSVFVEPNLAEATPNFDGRSQAKKDLDAVEAAIRAMMAGGAVAEYTIGNRSVRKMQMSDLLKIQAHLKDQVAREEKAKMIANGLGNPHNLYVRFK